MTSTSDPGDLQFERADFAEGGTSAPACGACQRPIEGTYFEVNGTTACPGCRDAIEHRYGGSAGPLGLVKAIGAGVLAGIAGALVYYAVLALTGYEIGLIAVLVGFVVGGAVRWGSGGRGGPSYQAIAVAITYLSIVSTYVPFMIAGVREASVKQHASAERRSAEGEGTSTERAASTDQSPPAPAAAAPASTTDASTRPPLAASRVLLAFVILGGIILASPFLAGFGNIMGWAIIGFALYEAWKRNRRVHLTIAGPFTLAAPGPAPAGAT
jgi:hypothetical protein